MGDASKVTCVGKGNTFLDMLQCSEVLTVVDMWRREAKSAIEVGRTEIDGPASPF